MDAYWLVALDDSIITKVGKKIFGCEEIFDHVAKSNQSKYPWAQNIVSVGLLKQIKGRWVCLFLDFRFYLPLTLEGIPAQLIGNCDLVSVETMALSLK